MSSLTSSTSGEYHSTHRAKNATSVCCSDTHYLHHVYPSPCPPRHGVRRELHIREPLPPAPPPNHYHPTVYQVQSITGKPISRRYVRLSAGPVQLRVGLLHNEQIHLLVLRGSTMDIILGQLWFAQHDPQISWLTGEVLKWGHQCFPTCFPYIPQPAPRPIKTLALNSTSNESPLEIQSVNIPTSHAPFRDVFCPQRASQLPPHRPWDCAIDLVSGEPVPRGKIYPLSLPKQKAMEEYIEEALQQGYIRPSTSPAASSFFFVAKKDGGLRPCIDYRALNKITVKFRYPLPLIPAALEHLRGAIIFTKLDLRSAYNLIRIREGAEWKTAFVMPTGHYECLVMPYGLINAPSVFQDFMHEVLREFLHRFILVYIDDILITLRAWPNIATTLQRSSNIYENSICSSRLRSVPSINP